MRKDLGNLYLYFLLNILSIIVLIPLKPKKIAVPLTKQPIIKRGIYNGFSGLAKAADSSMGPMNNVNMAKISILIPFTKSFLSVLFFVMVCSFEFVKIVSLKWKEGIHFKETS